jgi:hypothetical protein
MSTGDAGREDGSSAPERMISPPGRLRWGRAARGRPPPLPDRVENGERGRGGRLN